MDDCLAHYGVPGMKWGVRHNLSKAYEKANRKRIKLQTNAAKKMVKAEKLRNKAERTRYGITDTGRTIWKRRNLKADNAWRKATKATKKAEKWIKEMDKVFSDIPLSELKLK